MFYKYKIFLLSIFFFLCVFPIQINAQKVNKIVIDAGHGGHDPGAIGRNAREKDITLSVALKLRDVIKEKLPEIETILTRDNDVFVELYKRANIANTSKADLFISIHCNSAKSRAAYGAETFVMGLHKSEANLAVAKLENASILLEENYVSEYDGFDPTSPEGNIFFSMMQNSFLDKSLEFAGNIQHELVDRYKLHNRGVKQAGFLVLYRTAMPGVLIELGFISNAEEEKYLMSEKGQNEIVDAIYLALNDYNNSRVKKLENVTASNPEEETKNTNTNPNTVENTPISINSEIVYKVQFLTSDKYLPLSSRTFKGIKNVNYYTQNKSYKYVSGEFDSFKNASNYISEIKNKGYKDAFVVAFKDNKRINITDEMKN